MFSWVPPRHWQKDSVKAYQKSIHFLQNIVAESSRLDIIANRQSLPTVIVQGVSRRWYTVDTVAYSVSDFQKINGAFREVMDIRWQINVNAAAWRNDLVVKSPYVVSLCINSRREWRRLPIGDQVASLAMALQNDKTTAMRIPLLAQFIVSPRRELRGVYQFTEEGVVMNHELYMENGMEEVQDAEHGMEEIHDEEEAELWRLNELFEQYENEAMATRIENQQLDRWIERMVRETEPSPREPWHHDEENVWRLEDDLRKGRG